MSNGISERQNKESNIAKLAAQRQLYSNVGRIERVRVVFTVIIPLILAVIQEIAIELKWAKAVACFFSIAMLVISIILKTARKNNKEKAAAIQQEFDIDVYQMPWDRDLFGERRDFTEDIATYSKRILQNQHKREALLDWYTTEVDVLPLYDGIAACQKENFSWDAGLRKRYRTFSGVILVIIIFIPIVICLIKESLVFDLVLLWTMTLPAMKWCVDNIRALTDDINRMRTLESSIYSVGKKNIKNLQRTQKEIFENRRLAYKVPNWFYILFKNNDEDRERRAFEIGMVK